MIEAEDEDFLSQVAAAETEAEALSRKRRKITVSDASKHEDDEGVYTAALRGSKSRLWQQTTFNSLNTRSKGRVKVIVADNVFTTQSDGGGGECFKCGKSGHWARDCDAPIRGIGSIDPTLPEKACPCRLGSCLILTANTEKNRGHKFYKCPVREENGGCGFFKWCDKSSGTDNMTGGSQNYISNTSIPNLPCPYGAGSCLILTAKTGKNIGQQFYRCPANQESSSGFFKWSNGHATAGGLSVSTSKVNNMIDTNNKSYFVRSGSSYFKDGKEGHWTKDCTTPSSDSPVDVGGRSASSGTCYKCGKAGHWARDCPSSQGRKVWQRR